MITELDILTAVRNKLKTKYDYPINLSPVNANFETPCFVLDILDTGTRHSKALIYHNSTIYIDFIASIDEIESVKKYEIKETLFLLFCDGLTVKDRHLSTGLLDISTSGNDYNGIRVDIPVSYYDSLEEIDASDIAADKESEKYIVNHVGYDEIVKEN